MVRLVLDVPSREALERVLHAEIAKGRLFVPGAEVPNAERAPCEVVLAVPWGSHLLRGEVVFARAEEPGRGVGVALPPLDEPTTAALQRLAAGPVADDPADGGAPGGAGADGGEDLAYPAEAEAFGDPLGEAPADAQGGAAPEHEHAATTLLDRIRGLTSVEQQRLATSGGLQERIALERLFGPSVWEALLRNVRLTLPEVARIARKGTVPRPLLDVVAGNAAWLAAPEVQRALLSNPRSSPATVSRALHAMTRAELARVPQQTAYPASVRQAAKKLLG